MANLIIMLLDYSSTQFENIKLVREASINYVKEKMRADDWLAVFTLGASLRFLTDFTNDKEVLLAALQASDLTGSAMAAERASLDAGFRGGDTANMVFSSTSAPRATPSGPGAAGAAAGMGAGRGSQGLAMVAQRIAILHFAMKSTIDQRQGRNVLTALRAIALGVKGIEGRKSLVLFSEGFVVGSDLEDELHSVVDLASRAHLAVYCVESKGLETRELTGDLVPLDELTRTVGEPGSGKYAVGGESGFDRVRQVGRDMRESALRYVANATGGFLVRNTNDLGAALGRIDEEMHSYFLLSYRPKNTRFDGKYRQISVQVKRPGLSVRARPGYFAIPSGFEFLTPQEFGLVAQARSVSPKRELPFYLRTAAFRAEGRQYRVPVILEVPTTAVEFVKDQRRFTANLQVIGVVRDGTGGFVTRFGSPMNLHATEGEYQVLKPGSLSFLNFLELPPGAYSFEVLLRDVTSGKLARRQQGLFLKEPEPRLTLSSVLLSREVDKAGNAPDAFLSVAGAKILPSARCRFRNGDDLVFYFEIYDPQVDPKEQKTRLEIRLGLMSGGQPVSARLPQYQLQESFTGPQPRLTFAKLLKLAGLSPGEYSLVVEVRDNLGDRVERALAHFSLAN